MSKTVAVLLSEIAAKAGIPSDNKSLQHLSSLTELQGVEIPDDILTQFEQNIHSESSAKAKFANAFRKEAYDAVDKRIESLGTEHGLDDQILTAIKAEGTTQKRMESLTKKIAEIERTKAGGKNIDKDELNKLKEEKAKLASDYESKIATLTADHDNQLTGERIAALLSGYKLSIPDDVPAELKNQTAMQSVNAFLSEKGLKFKREKNMIKIVSATDDSDAYDEKNNKYEVKSVIDLALSRHNLLRKNEPNKVDINPLRTEIDGKIKQVDTNALNIIGDQLKDLNGVDFSKLH